MKKLLIILLLGLIAHMAFADCIGYNDSMTVRVLDGKYRLVPGALVTATYDAGNTFGPQYIVTKPISTASNGTVYLHLFNYAENTTPREVDCDIVLNAEIGGATGTTTIVANEHGEFVDIVISDVYIVNFYAFDQYAKPIANATIVIDNNKPVKTDATGMYGTYLKSGKHKYFISYLDFEQAGTIDVSTDMPVQVTPEYKTIEIDAVNDFNEPVEADLTIFNKTVKMADGKYINNKTYGTEIRYTAEYNGITKEGTITPASSPVRLVFDVHSPFFQSITPEAGQGKQNIVITVSDPGMLASGLDLSSLKVYYKTGGENATWDTAIVYTVGQNKFTAELPLVVTPGTIVQFNAEIQDKAGNKATIGGKFTSEEIVNNTTNTTQNQTKPQEKPSNAQEIPLAYIIIGVIVAILAVYVVIRIVSKPQGS